MVSRPGDTRTDAELADAARAGDAEAFVAFVDRLLNPVFDVVVRLVADPGKAAAIVRETFLRAAVTLPATRETAGIRGRVFGIALTLSAGAARGAPSPAMRADEALFEVPVAIGPGDSPAYARRVWRAACALDPRQRAILDLHIRQDLDAEEIAAAIHLSPANAGVVLRRLRVTADSEMRDHLLLDDAGAACPALATSTAGEMSGSGLRRVVGRHLRSCSHCRAAHSAIPSPVGTYASLRRVPAPPGLRDVVVAGVRAAWPAGPVSAAAPPAAGIRWAGASGSPDDALPGAGRGPVSLVAMATVVGMVVAMIVALAFYLPVGPFAHRDTAPSNLVVVPNDETPTPSGATSSPARAATPTSRASAATASPTVAPGTPRASSPTATSPAGVPAVATPTPVLQPSPTVPGRPTATQEPAPSPTPLPTGTPTPCVPALSVNVTVVNFGSLLNAQRFDLLNLSACEVQVVLQPSSATGWLAVSPTAASIPPYGTLVVELTASRDLLPAGPSSGVVSVVAQVLTLSVTVRIDGPYLPTPPVFTRAAICRQGSTIRLEATVTDEEGVKSVVYSDSSAATPLAFVSPAWTASAPYDVSAVGRRLVATDARGASTELQLPDTPPACE